MSDELMTSLKIAKRAFEDPDEYRRSSLRIPGRVGNHAIIVYLRNTRLPYERMVQKRL
jgi:hypothetical protein